MFRGQFAVEKGGAVVPGEILGVVPFRGTCAEGFHMHWACNTIQYNTIQYNTIQYNTIQYNTIQYNTIQYNTIQYNTIQICDHGVAIGCNFGVSSLCMCCVFYFSHLGILWALFQSFGHAQGSFRRCQRGVFWHFLGSFASLGVVG